MVQHLHCLWYFGPLYLSTADRVVTIYATVVRFWYVLLIFQVLLIYFKALYFDECIFMSFIYWCFYSWDIPSLDLVIFIPSQGILTVFNMTNLISHITRIKVVFFLSFSLSLWKLNFKISPLDIWSCNQVFTTYSFWPLCPRSAMSCAFAFYM